MSELFARGARLVPADLAPGQVALRASGVSVALGGSPVLHAVDLEVKAGELVALIGPNGAGKSTLLAALTGDVSAEGALEVAGTPLAAWRAGDLARRRAVLPQQNTVSFPFSVLEVVEMGRAPWRRTEREDDDEAAVAWALDRTDTSAFAARPFSALSGGERARAALARVLAQRTGILLLDEPTAALDIRHQEDVLQLLRERADAGDAVVVVLHDLSLAAAYADRLAMLDRGRLVAAGTPAEVLTAERVSAVYGYPVDVTTDPASGAPLVVPRRPARGPRPEEATP